MQSPGERKVVQGILKKLLAVLEAVGPVGWISIVALVAMGSVDYTLHEMATLMTLFLRGAN
jgi:hypothetical protein